MQRTLTKNFTCVFYCHGVKWWATVPFLEMRAIMAPPHVLTFYQTPMCYRVNTKHGHGQRNWRYTHTSDSLNNFVCLITSVIWRFSCSQHYKYLQLLRQVAFLWVLEYALYINMQFIITIFKITFCVVYIVLNNSFYSYCNVLNNGKMCSANWN